MRVAVGNCARVCGLALFMAVVACGEVPFVIRVVDEASGRGIPLVELRSVHQQRWVTDNGGRVAVDDPELLGEDVFFTVLSHGYEFEADGFGYRGRRLKVTPGGEATLSVKRINIAERLYRITGAGLFDHSVRAGLRGPLARPLLNGRVAGADSVQCVPFGGGLFWVWGDTNRLSYPLGNFHASGATSKRPAGGGLDPEVGIDLEYFVNDNGFAREMARMPGEGPTWLSGLAVVPDEEGEEHLVAHYVKVKPPMEIYERGLCEWNAADGAFRQVAVLADPDVPQPVGHAFVHRSGGQSWLYFADPLPTMRVPARYEAWKDPARYEAVEADEEFADAVTGARVKPHRGSISWNPFRRRWVMIFAEVGGTSFLGEIWYAEADSPEGPWRKAVKVITHDDYSFYNPMQHPWFAREDGREIFFEGTYTAAFSGNTDKTPKYDYNQIMYRLDLADPRLAPARE